MRVTERTRSILAFRRQRRDLLAKGYEKAHEPLWELHRGGRYNERIIDVQISTSGTDLYVLTDKRARALVRLVGGPANIPTRSPAPPHGSVERLMNRFMVGPTGGQGPALPVDQAQAWPNQSQAPQAALSAVVSHTEAMENPPMSRLDTKAAGRFEVAVSNKGAHDQNDSLGATISYRDGWNSGLPARGFDLSLEEMRDLHYILGRAIAQADSARGR